MLDTGGRGSRVTWSEALFLALVVLVTWLGEETSQAGPGSPWFDTSFFGVPLQYVLLGGLIALVLPYVAATPRFALTDRLKESGLWPWVVLSWAVISLALGIALVRGAPELFADWRNLAMTAVVAMVAAKWLAAQEWRPRLLVDLIITLGALCVPILASYVMGAGSSVSGVRTTAFESATLYLASFAAIGGFWYLLTATSRMGRLRVALVAMAAAVSGLVVLLSLRRSYWVMLGVGALVVLGSYMRSRQVSGVRLYAVVIGGVVMVVAMFLTLGVDTVLERVESFNPDSQGRFSNTNQDHVNDLIDAWGIIQQNPVFGYGIGTYYETNLIQEWKQNSFDVHNAILHVWLKFGVLGAIAFVGFHVAWARSALRSPNSIPIAAFVIGALVATLAATWPYGRFQVSVFLGVLLAYWATDRPPVVEDASVATPVTARSSS